MSGNFRHVRNLLDSSNGLLKNGAHWSHCCMADGMIQKAHQQWMRTSSSVGNLRQMQPDGSWEKKQLENNHDEVVFPF